MKHFNHAPIRAAVAVATFVALIATVGAPFKWSAMSLFELVESLTD